MDTIAFFFCVYEIISHEVLTKLRLYIQTTTLIMLTTIIIVKCMCVLFGVVWLHPPVLYQPYGCLTQ